jgi:hypothetical protein
MTNEKEAVEKVIGEPVFISFTDDLLRQRRNLLIVSSLAIFFCLNNTKTEDHLEFLGLQFEDINETDIALGLFITIFYLLVHFTWCSIDLFIEWRLRLTGTYVLFNQKTGVGNELWDYPTDYRQSTLQNWWKEKCLEFKDLRKSLEKFEAMNQDYSRLLADFSETNRYGTDELRSFTQLMHGTQERFKEEMRAIMSKTHKFMETIQSKRIPASLDRFEKYFRLFTLSQCLRWLIIEMIIPLALGSFSLILLFLLLSH